LVAVACFLPGRAKDLSAPWYVYAALYGVTFHETPFLFWRLHD